MSTSSGDIFDIEGVNYKLDYRDNTIDVSMKLKRKREGKWQEYYILMGSIRPLDAEFFYIVNRPKVENIVSVGPFSTLALAVRALSLRYWSGY